MVEALRISAGGFVGFVGDSSRKFLSRISKQNLTSAVPGVQLLVPDTLSGDSVPQ